MHAYYNRELCMYWRDGSKCTMHSCVAAADVASFIERAECELVGECVCVLV